MKRHACLFVCAALLMLLLPASCFATLSFFNGGYSASPSPAKAGDNVTITFWEYDSYYIVPSVTVTVNGHSTSNLQNLVHAGPTSEFSCTYTVLGSGQDPDGAASIEIYATDSMNQSNDYVNTSWLLLDSTNPTTPAVTDDGAYTTSTSLHASWTASSATSGVAEYQYAIGTTSGGTNTVGWTSVGTSTSVTTGSLSLTSGQTYYISVKAKSNVGLWSSVGTSDGIMFDTTPPADFTPTTSPTGWSGWYYGVAVLFSTTDSGSGFDHYEIAIDNGAFSPSNIGNTDSAPGGGPNRDFVVDDYDGDTDYSDSLFGSGYSQVTYGPGYLGDAAVFSTATDYIAYDGNYMLATRGTMGFYLKGSRSQGHDTIVDTCGPPDVVSPVLHDMRLTLTSNNSLKYQMYDGTNWHVLTGTTQLDSNKWYYVAISYGHQGMKLYVNGTQEGSFDGNGDFQWPTNDDNWAPFFALGDLWWNTAGSPGDTGDPEDSFAGSVDSFRTSYTEADSNLTSPPKSCYYRMQTQGQHTVHVKAVDAVGNYRVKDVTTYLDNTPPTTPVVTGDGTYAPFTLRATWTASTAPSGIAQYQYAVGTTSGGTQLVNWTAPSPATSTSMAVGNLPVVAGTTYYISVKAQNNAGIWSSVGTAGTVYSPSGTNVAVSSTANSANRGVHGVHEDSYGEEFRQPQYSDQYTGLFSQWNYGFVRAECWNQAWDAERTPVLKWLHSLPYFPTGRYMDEYGHRLEFNWYVSTAQNTNTTVDWLVNMNGNADSYGQAVVDTAQDTDTKKMIQGAYDNGQSGPGQPTESEKANWWNPNSSDSIIQRAKDLATASASSGINRVYELGNEVWNGFYIPEAYWMLADGSRTRRAWGDEYRDQLSGWGDCNRPAMLDWSSSGSIGTSGKKLYMGFAYKPCSLHYNMNSAGIGGHVIWQYYRPSDGTWQTLSPSGIEMQTNTGQYHWYMKDSAGNGYNAQTGDPTYDDVTSFRVGSNWNCTLDFLPMPVQYSNGNWSPVEGSAWETSGNHYDDWDRGQPSDLIDNSDPLNPKNIRSLYWVRIYADQVYTTAPNNYKIGTYLPDIRNWLDTSKAMSAAIKQGDSGAKVFTPGGCFTFHYSSGQVDGYSVWDWYSYELYYYLNVHDNTYNYRDFWDGIVIHPYVYPSTASQLLTMADDSAGLLKMINDTRALLNYENLTSKQIACTEWGYYSSPAICVALAQGLYYVDGTLSMMATPYTSGVQAPDYAAWFFGGTWNGVCPFYTNNLNAWGGTMSAPDSSTVYTVRPLGLGMKLVANCYRANIYTLLADQPVNDIKAFAFGESGKTSTMVLINKTSSNRTVSLSWAAVANKEVYASYLQSTNTTPSLLDNNEPATGSSPTDPITSHVVLTNQADTSITVGSNGSFSITLPPYSATGLEFKDN